GYNLLSTVGAFVLAAGFLLYFANAVWSLWRGAPAPADPWGGETLEWSVASPPPSYMFFRPPVVRSRHPLWEEGETPEDDASRRAADALAGRPEGWRATLLTSVASARPEGVQWLPGPTFAPLRLAGALLLLALGTL